jgi:uncharacterized protein (TIGR02266 family)
VSTAERAAPAEPQATARARRAATRTNERRDRVRCEVHLDIDVQSSAARSSAVTRDLSVAGAFIVTDLELPIGGMLELKLHLPRLAEPLCCVGEVRWSRPQGCESGDPAGVGVRFVAPDTEVRRAIQSFLLEHAPLEVDE